MSAVELTEEERRVVMDTIDALKWEGWQQGAMGGARAPSCVSGGFGKAASGGRNVWAAPTSAEQKFRSWLPRAMLTVWNDAIATSLDYVLWTLAEFAGLDPASVLPDEDDLEVMP